MAFSTQKDVDKLVAPAGSTDAFVADKIVKGLYVRIQGNRRTWVIRYDSDGRRKKYLLGEVAALSLADARKKAAEEIGRIRNGADPLAERAAKASAPKKMTFGDLVEKFIRIYAEKSQRPKTLVETKRSLNVHMKPLHDLPVDEVTRRHLAERFQALVETSGPIMANRVRAATSTTFSWAMKQGLAETNPVVGTAPPAAERRRDRVLAEEELRLIWHALDGSAADYRDIVRLLILLGQRANEVAGMRWSEVDMDRALWVLPASRTKNARTHEVPLPDAALAILRPRHADRDEGRDLVFGRRAGPFSGWSVAKAQLDKRLASLRAEQIGKKKTNEALWVIHDIRHTVITGMNELAIDPHIVEGIANHLGIGKQGVAGVYNHAQYRGPKRAALDKWAAHIDQVANGKSSPTNVVKLMRADR
ncbi:MAG TPA: tyrosine-type recombinase/integrase [Geminicoccus sp.]|jgi:integrase|uniref:tyrosine-type recombinase/integrase n=1 Tax=Geminicoccus sp. TaxID=2024832 RepID=UPI002E2EBCD9|nr:tyrosine-type recombinase/integrase [Geminicoccus sp.]HEX2526758.1 tyrosine-type recombinase/integrase [Geminicoccus sp.]